MDLHLFVSVVLLALTVCNSKSCQEPWKLNTKALSYGGVIGFKNVTTIGKQESLTWSWTGEEQEFWELRMLRSFEEENIDGKITYRKADKAQKTVIISWLINEKDLSSMGNNKRIFSKPWGLSICNGLNVQFITDKRGSWEFQIGDFLLQRRSENRAREYNHDRRRRAEDFEVTEYPQTNTNRTKQPGGPFDCIYDYFFAEEDPTTGRSGIFTRVKNWMKNVTCQLGIGCGENDQEPGYLPMPTVPPPDPDAETITVIPRSANDVWSV